MARREYDAIIVGASFAGLAVARELRGEVLLLDRYEVGTHPTSACGTPLWLVERLGVKESVIQVHTRQGLQWAVRKMPGAWLGPLAELSTWPPLLARWWPRYLGFGRW